MFWFAKEVRELCIDGDALLRNGHSGTRQSQKHAIRTQANISAVLLPSLLLSARGEHHTPSLLSDTALLAAILNSELLTRQGAPVMPTEAARHYVITPFFNSPVLLQIVRKSVLNISSTQKRFFCYNLFQAHHDSHLLSMYIPVLSADSAHEPCKF